MKTSCLRLKLVELNFFASFNADAQSKLAFLTLLNIHPSRQDEPFQLIFDVLTWLAQLPDVFCNRQD